MGLNHRPTIYETVALPLSYAGSQQNLSFEEDLKQFATLTEKHYLWGGYTFRHLVSSTKDYDVLQSLRGFDSKILSLPHTRLAVH